MIAFQETVVGGTASDIMVTVTGNSNHSGSAGLSNTIDRVITFMNHKPAESLSPGSQSLSERNVFTTLDSGSLFGNALDPRISTYPPRPANGIAIHGNGSSTLKLQGTVTDFSSPSQNHNILDSSAGGNRIIIDQGTVIAGHSVNDTISATADLRVIGGKNETVTAGGHLEFIGGTGNSSVSAHDAIIYGTSDSVYHFVSTSPGSVNADGIEGDVSQFMGAKDQNGLFVHDILFDASSSHGAFTAIVGNKDTIIGGTAADKFTVNSDTHESGDGKDVAATLTGGSGAANLFEFMDNEGGRYTITDFGSAAGNLVAINGTKSDVKDALKNATIEGGNTTIRLKDNTEITFVGDTHLSEKDFITNLPTV